MRNIVIAILILGSAGSIFMYDRSAAAQSRRESEQLKIQIEATGRDIVHPHERIQHLEARRAAQAQAFAEATARLEQERSIRTNIPPASLNPTREGHWPEPRPSLE